MRRIIDTRQTNQIGRCVYCGTTEGDLSDEHVTPLGLGGRLVLLDASCERHSNTTSALELKILRGLFAARAALSTPTRRKKERAAAHPMLVERAGKIERVDAVWQDHWKVIRLPIFPLPACVDGRRYKSGIELTSMDIFELAERGEEIARRHNADRVLPPDYSAEEFARFVAKVAYGYAVDRYGLEAFERVYVLPAMLGETNTIGQWVGCSPYRELPVRECIVSVAFWIHPLDDLVVRVKMFAQFDGAEYVVVVGRMKELYRNYFHACGRRG